MQQYSIVDIGKELQKYGLRVGQNPAFGPVGKHAPGSYHYSGQAIDVTDWRPDIAPAFEGGKPIHWKQRKGELSYRAKKSGLFTEALGPGDPGHSSHVHLALKDKAPATPQLLQWIATGRYKTPEGKLSDVMPGITANTQVAQTSQPQQKPADTYIFIGGRPREKESSQDFLSSYIRQSLMGEVPQIKSMIDPASMLAQAFSQTPNYLS